ncbi:MAG: hypothetical protein JST83_11835 [Bacteroidetes bacterium]|nr:hypothetical protein [Bacteroidota bacterium]
MRNVFLLFTVFLTVSVSAQSSSIPQPEFPSRPYFLRDSTFHNLEKVEANFDLKIKGGGFGGADQNLTAFKAQSPIRFDKNNIPPMYIQIDGSGDPSDKVSVSIAQIKKDRRRFVLESTSLGGKAKDMSETKVSVSLKKVREGLYQIVFDAPLVPGEYAFMPQMDMGALMGGGKLNLFCFGIY